MYEDLLLEVKRPAQYIGHEWNSSRKSFDAAYLKFALSFPDLYEIGMSNLGIRIIYGLLNDLPDVVCERFFAVDGDLEKQLRLSNREILSLESRRKLADFDFIGFSLGSELDYTNVLNILDLSSFPFKASERNHYYPLVIGGGPCTLNPEPMHDFFDLFVIGEAEGPILQILSHYRQNKEAYRAGKISKSQLLFLFSGIEGVYVPSLYKVNYDDTGKIRSFVSNQNNPILKIKKSFVKELASSYYPQKWIVPYTQIIHDRVTVEIMRGCPNRCRFCQARLQYFPLRYRNPELVLNLANDICKDTGYEEISLSGLSVSDYPGLDLLLERLSGLLKPNGVGISLPSIKAKDIVGKASVSIAKFKKTGLTFAPEAGSERLRDLLAKDFNCESFFRALREAYSCGYQHVKLYFMIGLPSEKDDDLDAIVEFSSRVSDLRKELGKPAAAVNISINTLIPKPHTALQWFSMSPLEEIEYKQDYLRNKFKRLKKLKVSFHDPKMSFLEGVLSRGDRRLSSVILNAFNKGARFDAWGSHFDFGLWSSSFQEANIDPYFYLQRRGVDETLPWDFIDTGIPRSVLVEDFNKTIAI